MKQHVAHGFGKRTLIFLVLTFFITPGIFEARGQQLRFTKCDPQPLPLQLEGFDNQPQDIDFRCGNQGCPSTNLANKRQNAVKNNFCAPTNNIRPITIATFRRLQEAVNALPNFPQGEPPTNRARLRNIISFGNGRLGEGDVVSFVGFVISRRHSNVDPDRPLTRGNGESVQCNLLSCAYNDIHIDLVENPNGSGSCRHVTAELIPHYRPAAWNLFDSPDYDDFIRRHPARIRGQLFFDGSHTPCSGGSGLSVWEIHPVYALDLCENTTLAQCQVGDESDWFPLTQLQSRLGLSTVRA